MRILKRYFVLFFETNKQKNVYYYKYILLFIIIFIGLFMFELYDVYYLFVDYEKEKNSMKLSL